MGKLIPLRLQHFQADTRSRSISSPSNLVSVPSTEIRDRWRPVPVTELTIFPYTEEEWRDVMEEVRVLYMKRQYKQCSARGIQIAEGIKDPYRVHPLYQIYISFFTASSLELTSRSLHLNSSTKLPLLEQSLNYYQNAESLVQYASFSADPTMAYARRQSRNSSISSTTSSVRSSVDSIFSATSAHSSSSAASSAEPSPTSSCYSSDIQTHKRAVSAPASNPCAAANPAALRMKKKVSFSLQLPIRILSDDELALASPSTIISAFPNPPKASMTNSTTPTLPTPVDGSAISDFLLSRALLRYRSHLSSLHNQLHHHVKSVEEQIAGLQRSRKAWRNNHLPDFYLQFGDGAGLNGEEVKKAELRGRIERLKADGWGRTRFNGKRYQDLCDKALVELE